MAKEAAAKEPEEIEDQSEEREENAEKEEKEQPAEIAKDDDGNVIVRQPKPSHSRRRGQAYAELQEKVRRGEENEARRDREIAELRSALSRGQSQPPAQTQSQPDPYRSFVQNVREQQEDISLMLRSAKTDEDANRLRK